MTRGIIISTAILLGLTVLSCGLSLLILKLYSNTKNTEKKLLPDLVKLLNLKPNDRFVDLGAGDFRVVFAVAQRFNISAIGYEISPLHLLRAKIQKLFTFKGKSNIRIEAKSLYLAEITGVDVFYLNLDKEILLKAFAKIEQQAKDTSRIFVYNLKLDSYDPSVTHTLKDGITLYEYELSKIK